MRTWLVVTAMLCMLCSGLIPAWADSSHDTIINGDSIVNNTATATGGAGGAGGAGGSVGNISNNGGTHIQTTTVTPIQTTTVTPIQTTIQDTDNKLVNKPVTTTTVEVKTDVPRQAPPAVAPALSVSTLSCYGTWGVGASTPFGGLSAGFPTLEQGCTDARTAMVLQSLGQQQAALLFYANTNPAIRDALVKAGTLPKEAVDESAPVKPVASLHESAVSNALTPDLTSIPAAMAATQARRVADVQQ